MTAYNAMIKLVAPTTGAEKKAYRREKARNTQAQVKPTPLMTPYAIRDHGTRRCLNFSVPSSSIVGRVANLGVIATKARLPTAKTDKPTTEFPPNRSSERNAMKPYDATIKLIPRKAGQKKQLYFAFITMTLLPLPRCALLLKTTIAKLAHTHTRTISLGCMGAYRFLMICKARTICLISSERHYRSCLACGSH